MYKLSKYTHLTELKDSIALYNSYTENIAQIKDKQKFQEFFSDFSKYPNFESLYQDGFIVKKNTDETRMANAKFLKKWANKDLMLTLLPSLECNFRCSYCYENFEDRKFSDQNVKDIELFVKKNISNYSKINIGWFGGEPLLEVDTINELSQRLIEICRFFKKTYSANMTTNGYFLTPTIFKQMLSNKIYSYQITLDGLAKTHNQYRMIKDKEQGDTFDVIINNLREIKKVKSKFFNIIVRTNVTKEIFDNLENYLKFLHKEFSDDSRFKFLFRLTGNWGLLFTAGLKKHNFSQNIHLFS